MEALSQEAGPPAAGGRAPEEPALVFVGFMGAGKSGAARLVAAELGLAPIDSDAEIERELGESVESLFDREGESAFREREEAAVLALLEAPDARVVSLGGGALGSERVRAALQAHTVVHLDVEPAEAWRRVSKKGRPLARDRERFEALHAERRPVYEEVADATVLDGGRDAALRASHALAALGHAPTGTRLVWASAASGDYPVFCGPGLIQSGFFHPVDGRRFVVTDEHVARHHELESAEHTIRIPAGEQAKTLSQAEAVLRELARAEVEGGDLVVALGGGVLGDLAGFCAAVYQRGIRHVQVPTTLVSQVDSAFGGKTGVDLPEAKNYAGAYHQPAAVLVDPAALETLPPEELAAGYAEVVKTALIAGGELWEQVGAGADVDERIIMACIRAKLGVVAEDERDAGRRQVLNLGHTVAHAIEAATGYARYRHGEAVAIGLLCALRLSGRDELRAQVARLFEARGLPAAFDGASADEVLALVARDKKRSGGEVPFVLVDGPGAVSEGQSVDAEELRAAIEEARAA